MLLDMACTTCTAGNYCPVGATTETPCAAGFYSAAGASACSPCPAGSECSTATVATACATGEYALAQSVACTICPVGKIPVPIIYNEILLKHVVSFVLPLKSINKT